MNIFGERATDAADGEKREPGDQHGFASPAVARPSERYLEDALGERVNPESHAGERGRCSRVLHRISAEDRQHEKDA